MTKYSTQSHYPDSDTELTSIGPIIIISCARLESDKYQFDKSLVSLDQEPSSRSPSCEARTLPIRSLRPACKLNNMLIKGCSFGFYSCQHLNTHAKVLYYVFCLNDLHVALLYPHMASPYLNLLSLFFHVLATCKVT